MMGRQDRDQRQLFYEFSLDEMIPTDHLLRRINVFATAVLADLHEQLKAFYSDIGRPSVDPELMIRMLLVGYCYGIRHERRLCQEVALHLAYRWFCKLDLDDKVPHHSTFSVNRLGEHVVATCMAAGLIKGEGFAVDASVMEANASRYHGKAPDELDWTDAQRQKRAVAEYLAGLETEAQIQEGGDSRDGGSDGKPTAAPDRNSPEGGFALVVDGHFKTQFESDAAAQKFAKELLTNYPMLHVEIYDASTKGRTLVRR